jgi:adenylosuccinate lyase
MKNFDHKTYLSPFTWRYGSLEMREIWSEVNKRKLWRKVWVALAKAQYEAGLVNKEELDDLRKHQNDIDIERAEEIEAEVRHDLMAEVKAYSEKAKIGAGKIHLGATSMDVEDNADTLREKESLVLIEKRLHGLLLAFKEKITKYKGMPCMGYTHLQPAEPTTVGYRFAFYAQDLLLYRKLLNFVAGELKGKGMKGAVGTCASYVKLLGEKKAAEVSDKVMEELHIDAATVASQTAPRKFELLIASALSSIAASLYKFAFDLRLMQSPGFGEWQEPFGGKQVGSSAMPFKRNPWKAEQICSLARLVFNLANTARDNSANMLLERTLDDSANRRVFLPEMFLAVDEMLRSGTKILEGLLVSERQIAKNLLTYGPFAATEAVLMAAVKKGGNRQELHEVLRELSLEAWEAVSEGRENPLTKLISNDKRVMQFVDPADLKKLLDSKMHIGLAPKFCEKLLKEIT